MAKKTLYLCYFGLREPLVQTQVLPYLREIVKGGTAAHILTFETNPKESWTPKQIAETKQKLAAENIEWDFLTYHKRLSVPATVFDIMNGARFAVKLNRKEKIDVFHGRAHFATLMGAIAKKFTGSKLLFDIRGFIPEEYTDAGIWKENGLIYKAVKRVEKYLLKKSDAFVVLTERAAEILFPESKETGSDAQGRPFEVIPCCIDRERFKDAELLDKEKLKAGEGLAGKKVFIYVGSFGGWYMTEEIINFFKYTHQRIPNAFTIILTPRERNKVEKKLIESGLDEKSFLVKSVAPIEVPKYLKMSDVAISFIRACYSKQASSPTKIAEYLACGLPVVLNTGVGDLDELINTERVGVVIKDFNKEDFEKALDEIELMFKDADLSERCKETAYRRFDLERVAGERYRRIYQRILQK